MTTKTTIEALQCTSFETKDPIGKPIRIFRTMVARPPLDTVVLENASTHEIIEEANKIYHSAIAADPQRTFRILVRHEGRRPKGFVVSRSAMERFYIQEKQK